MASGLKDTSKCLLAPFSTPSTRRPRDDHGATGALAHSPAAHRRRDVRVLLAGLIFSAD